MQRFFVSTVVTLAVCISTIVCDSKRPSPEVTIQSAKHSGDVGLLGGEPVQFEIKVRADGFDKPRKVAFFVQSADQTIGVAGSV